MHPCRNRTQAILFSLLLSLLILSGSNSITVVHANYVKDTRHEGQNGCTVENKRTTLEQIPFSPTFQDETGTCYGHSAYQLLHYFHNWSRWKNGGRPTENFQVEALSLLYVLLISHNEELLHGSYVDTTLKSIQNSGNGFIAFEPVPRIPHTLDEIAALEWKAKNLIAERSAHSQEGPGKHRRAQQPIFVAGSTPTREQQSCKRARHADSTTVAAPLLDSAARMTKVLEFILDQSPSVEFPLIRSLQEGGYISKDGIALPKFNVTQLLPTESLDKFPDITERMQAHFESTNPQPVSVTFTPEPGGSHAVTVTGIQTLCCPHDGIKFCKTSWQILDSALPANSQPGWVLAYKLLQHTRHPQLVTIQECRGPTAPESDLPICESGQSFQSPSAPEKLGRSRDLPQMERFFLSDEFQELTPQKQITTLLRLLNSASNLDQPIAIQALVKKLKTYPPTQLILIPEIRDKIITIAYNLGHAGAWNSLFIFQQVIRELRERAFALFPTDEELLAEAGLGVLNATDQIMQKSKLPSSVESYQKLSGGLMEIIISRAGTGDQQESLRKAMIIRLSKSDQDRFNTTKFQAISSFKY